MHEIAQRVREINEMLFDGAPLSVEVVEAIVRELGSLGHQIPASAIARSMLGRSNRFNNPSSWQVQFSKDDIIFHAVEGFELELDKYDHSVSLPIAYGAYEGHMLSFFNSHLKEGMVALDIGANIGLYTMQFARLVGTTGKVIAFEPNSENCRLLMLSMQKNGFNNIELLPFALSDKRGAHLFTTAIGTNGTFTDQRHDLMSRGCSVVPTLTLGSLDIGHVDLMKLDVEGAEYMVLHGAEKLIEKCRPIITTEFSLDMLSRISGTSGADYFAWFARRGYSPFHIPRDGSNPSLIGDVVAFLATYEKYQIEDLAFFPGGK
jgi:FkbM family methyltransferase